MRAAQIISTHSHSENSLLPILRGIQEEFGYTDEAGEPVIAHALNITRAQVHGRFAYGRVPEGDAATCQDQSPCAGERRRRGVAG